MEKGRQMPGIIQEPIGYQHPRWLVRVAALGFAVLYAGAIAVKNIFPNGYQEHGWPFVYMVRQRWVPGPLCNITYGPWPLYNPPLAKFWPELLALNVLIGAVLVGLASVVPCYWLRLRKTPVHFSLRSLLGLTTIVACLLAVWKTYYRCEIDVWTLWSLLIIAGIILFEYVVPACLVVTAAHWLVVHSVAAGRYRRWLGLHWLTWIAVFAVGGPCLYGSIIAGDSSRGWPLEYYLGDSWVGRHHDGFAFFGDLLLWHAMTIGTGFVVEDWIRRVEREKPMRKAAFLAMALAFVAATWILIASDSLTRSLYYRYPCYFGLFAVIYASPALSVRYWKAIPKRSLFAGIGLGVPLWFVLMPLLADDHLVTGLSLVAGSIVAAAVDAVYRLVAHRERGISRFVRPDCGGHIAYVPGWAFGIAGIIGGLLLVHL